MKKLLVLLFLLNACSGQIGGQLNSNNHIEEDGSTQNKNMDRPVDSPTPGIIPEAFANELFYQEVPCVVMERSYLYEIDEHGSIVASPSYTVLSFVATGTLAGMDPRTSPVIMGTGCREDLECSDLLASPHDTPIFGPCNQLERVLSPDPYRCKQFRGTAIDRDRIQVSCGSYTVISAPHVPSGLKYFYYRYKKLYVKVYGF